MEFICKETTELTDNRILLKFLPYRLDLVIFLQYI